MNCKFCNNFIPDDAKTCPICGKDVVETPVETISTRPAPTPNLEPVAQPEAAEEQSNVTVVAKKKLLTPGIILIIGLAALAYLYLPFKPCLNASQLITSGFNSLQDSKDANNDDDPTNPNEDGTVETDRAEAYKTLGLTGGGSLLGAVVAIGGGAMLGKRAKFNSKVNKMMKK